MEVSTPISAWLSQLEMEDLMLCQEPYGINSLDELMTQSIDDEFMALNMNQNQNQRLNQNENHLSVSSSTESNSNVTMNPTTITTTKSKPTRKQPRVQNTESPTSNTCFPVILNFGSSLLAEDKERIHQEEYVAPLKGQRSMEDEEEAPPPKNDFLYGNFDDVIDEEPPAKRKYSKKTPTTSTKEHIMAERRRREKLSQRFAALSALIPGLKRMDKTSILAEAIKHLKELQEKIKNLEEDTAKRSVESVMLVKKTRFTSVEEDNHSSSCNEFLHSTSQGHEQLPEIEAKLSNKNMLVKITCEKGRTHLSRVLAVVEKYNLSVTTVHATPFGDRTLDVTVIAQMEKEFEPKLQDILQELSFACRKA